jgi:streptogramin lyase
VDPSGAITPFSIRIANTNPVDITAGCDGDLWFTQQSSNQIAHMTTAGELAAGI